MLVDDEDNDDENDIDKEAIKWNVNSVHPVPIILSTRMTNKEFRCYRSNNLPRNNRQFKQYPFASTIHRFLQELVPPTHTNTW